MTNLRRSGSGSGSYVPGTEPATRDIFQLSSPAEYEADSAPIGQGRFTILRDTADYTEFRLEWHTLHGGTNKSRGSFLEDHARYKLANGVYCGFPGHAVLTPKLNVQAAPDAEGDLVMRHVTHLDELVMSMGDATYSAGVSAPIFKETSPTDPTVVTAGATSPNEDVLSMNQVVTGGQGRQVVIGYKNDAPIIWPQINGVGTGMNATLEDLWDCVQLALPDSPIMLYANTKLYQLATYFAAPSVLIDEQPPGGYLSGLLRMGAAPLRVYFVMPKDADLTTSMLTYGAEKPGFIKSFNQRGRDPQEYIHDLRYVKWAIPYRGGLWIAEDEEALWTNSVRTRNLQWFADRPNSDLEHRFRGFWVRGRQLVGAINAIASPNSTTDTLWWAEEYNFETGAIHPVTRRYDVGDTGLQGVTGPSLPISQQSGYAYQYVGGKWLYFYLPKPRVNPYSLRQTSGAGEGTGLVYESETATLELPELSCPGALAYLPKRVKAMHFGGELDGAGAKIKITESGGKFHEFLHGYNARSQSKVWDQDDGHRFTDPAPVLTFTQGTNVRTTPQALPFAIDYIAYKNEPRSVRSA